MTIVDKNYPDPKREMGCFLCGCKWWVIGDAIVTRPPCPQCGGCKDQGIHLKDLLVQGLEKYTDSKIGAVTGAIAFNGGSPCPDDSFCTTGATDTFGMFYDETALTEVGIFPNWHDHPDEVCIQCGIVSKEIHSSLDCITALKEKLIKTYMRHGEYVKHISKRFSDYVKSRSGE